jgi:heme A synthase
MNKTKSILQSIGAVLAGYIVSAVLTVLMIAVLGALFPISYQPENVGWVVFNVIYGCAFAVVGGYVVAWLAPSRPVAHAVVLSLLMAAFAALTGIAVATAPPSPEYANQPGWYYPVLAITVIPSIVLGAWVYTRMRERKAVEV